MEGLKGTMLSVSSSGNILMKGIGQTVCESSDVAVVKSGNARRPSCSKHD